MLAHLMDISVRSFLLAIAAALALWTLRKRRTAALEHAVWATVVCGMLALFVFGNALPRLPLRILTAPIAAVPAAIPEVPYRAEQTPSIAPLQSGPPAGRRPIGWQQWIVFAYGAVSVGFLTQFATAIFLVRRLLATGRSIPYAGKTPVYESEAIAVPVTIGWLRPKILLPMEWREWDPAKLDAVLAHEGAHARRRDVLVAAVASVNRCIFWFHPLAWILQRKLALLAEQACDESCVAELGDRQRYANLLVEMASVVEGNRGRLRLHALTMATGSHIRHRVDSLLQEDRTFSRGLTWAAWAAVALCGVPMVLLAGALDLDRPSPLLTLEVPRTAPPAAPSSGVLFAPTRSTRPAAAAPIQVAQVHTGPAQVAASAKFDSASIKSCGPADGAGRSGRGGGKGRGIPMSPAGEFFVNCLSVWELINHYVETGNDRLLNNASWMPFDRERVRSGPSWIYSDLYTIDAKTSDPLANGSAPGEAQARRVLTSRMLQALLEDRFQLRTRRETEEIPMYALVVSDGGLKLQPMEEGGCIVHDPSQGVRVPEMFPPGQKPLCTLHVGFHGPNWTLRTGGQTLAQVAGALGGAILDRPVLDKTGIAALFNVQLEFARDGNASGRFPPELPPPPADPTVPVGPSISTVLDQVGLKLVPDKGPREYLVIDSVQRPSLN